jgi:hypothetical protein
VRASTARRGSDAVRTIGRCNSLLVVVGTGVVVDDNGGGARCSSDVAVVDMSKRGSESVRTIFGGVVVEAAVKELLHDIMLFVVVVVVARLAFS